MQGAYIYSINLHNKTQGNFKSFVKYRGKEATSEGSLCQKLSIYFEQAPIFR